MSWKCEIQQAYAWSKDSQNILIDVRIIEERISSGLPKNAVCYFLNQLAQQQDELMESYDKIMLLCTVGHESLDFCQHLNPDLYQGRVFSVDGGFDAWFLTDLPIQKYQPPNDLLRYDRQMRLTGVGFDGQKKLKKAHVIIVGVGGLGVSALQYLAVAGIGKITIIDDDKVSMSNLHRQVIYQSNHVGLLKVNVAKEWVAQHNPEVVTKTINKRLTGLNANGLIQDADCILDCSDNFATRLVINELAITNSIPWVFAAVTDFEIQMSFFDPTTLHAPCFQCLFPVTDYKQDQQCNTLGVMGVTPGTAGILQASEVIKYLLGFDGVLRSQLLVDNLLTHRSKVIKYHARKSCPKH